MRYQTAGACVIYDPPDCVTGGWLLDVGGTAPPKASSPEVSSELTLLDESEALDACACVARAASPPKTAVAATDPYNSQRVVRRIRLSSLVRCSEATASGKQGSLRGACERVDS
jgi:hypothetical protein